MENTTLVALISATGAFIVSVISLISAAISSRNAAKSSKEIETLKHELAMERQGIDEKNRTYSEFLNSLCVSIKVIQKVKDAIQRIVDAYKTAHHSEIAINDITAASKELFECYENHFTELLIQDHKLEKELFHKAKSFTLRIEGEVKSGLEQKMYASEITIEEKESLRDLRSRLSEIQNQLQNSVSEILTKRYSNRIR